MDVSGRSAFLDSLYLSLVTLATLGYGDIVPAAAWLRVVAPLEGLIGFALLTAAVSWVLQVYPALARRRALAVRLSMLRKNDAAGVLGDLHETVAAGILDELSEDLVQIRVDLTQYGETYFYGESDPRASLPAAGSYALQHGQAGDRRET